MINFSIDNVIFNIEDYVGGNIEGIKDVDRMAFTVFLRNQLTQAQQELIEKIEGSLPKKVPDILVRENGDGSRTVQIDPRNQFIDEVTTLLKQAKEGL